MWLRKEDWKKLKPGDKVRCAQSHSKFFTVGKTYTLKKSDCKSHKFLIISDTDSYKIYNVADLSSKFKLVEEPKYVWCFDNDTTPMPTNAITHALPDGTLMWCQPASVIEDLEYEARAIKSDLFPGYRFLNTFTEIGLGVNIKGKTKDGKPFG